MTTHTNTTDAYRGAGRPEAAYYLERIIDMYAREIGMDPAEVRKKNYVPNDQFPGAVSPVGFAMDTGDYANNLDALIASADYAGLRAEQERARSEGRYLGDRAHHLRGGLRVRPGRPGRARLLVGRLRAPVVVQRHRRRCGSTPTGGHRADRDRADRAGPRDDLGADRQRPARRSVRPRQSRHGDTARLADGHRHLRQPVSAVGGPAVATGRRPGTGQGATDRRPPARGGRRGHRVRRRRRPRRRVAGQPVDLGRPGRHRLSWRTSCPRASSPGWRHRRVFDPTNATWPFGTHLAVVEVDPETGDVELLRYIAVDDCGDVISPMIVAGQVHGGLAQGIGQALFEEASYDENGQPADRHPDRLPAPDRGGPAQLRAGPHRDPDRRQPPGGEGHRRGGDDRVGQTGVVTPWSTPSRPLGVQTHRHAAAASATCGRRYRKHAGS